MIKYAPKQDRRTFAEKNAIYIFSLIALIASLALYNFHEETKGLDQVKNPDPEILEIVFAIHSQK